MNYFHLVILMNSYGFRFFLRILRLSGVEVWRWRQFDVTPTPSLFFFHPFFGTNRGFISVGILYLDLNQIPLADVPVTRQSSNRRTQNSLFYSPSSVGASKPICLSTSWLSPIVFHREHILAYSFTLVLVWILQTVLALLRLRMPSC